MGFWSSKFQVVVDDKRARRDKLLSSAHTYVESEHGAYVKATGKPFPLSKDASYVHQRRRRPAFEITKRIGSGEWSASQVIESYIARAAYAHSITNCGTESKPKDQLISVHG